ncbi:RNA-binding transcriptional accessory protein [Siphonobacter sp. BAB-5385]|uniref:Tex family protein n=1 Tax=Siphonobacter sp. BAB-5385 TaxID=1864822 RepID=UPI000B9E882D|nr:Tex family protein [Siphonobacter sp. BAB-5385]OZI06041.1 RNA-binding transcriptional accessory protein [Siphonobacter sp. BAB-5385]
MRTAVAFISSQLSLSARSVEHTIQLFDEGATVPFIARYRKEMTGSLDEVQIQAIKDQYEKFKEVEKRRESILQSIQEQGKLTAELRKQLEAAQTLTQLEDLYLPYKPKRKTKASIAIEKGLEPLARLIFEQRERDITGKAQAFVNEAVPTLEEAYQGASDIMAEWISENADARNAIRKVFERQAIVYAKLKKNKAEEGAKYRDYFDFSEELRKIPSHRLLAIRRGEEEGILSVSISPDEERSLEQLDRLFVRGSSPAKPFVEDAITDSYKRLIKPSIENEFARLSKEKADAEAITIFVGNLRQLLLSSPLGQKRVLGIDPGYRTGCKTIVLDAQGNLLSDTVLYPFDKKQEAEAKVRQLIASYQIEAVAVGNGTAGRETEDFLKGLSLTIPIFMVSEQGASIYSASEVARDEFPDKDITVRGAVSIGRRLMDPLAELVKIDPKSIGVGQYQHDVDQGALKKSLDTVVESCVNAVGVNLNTASKHLLSYVSGLGPTLAQNIVTYRREHGAFKSRKELLKVPRLGGKAFEQCAGFLRIAEAANPLDNSAVHPESYDIVERMAKDLGVSVKDLMTQTEQRKKIQLQKYVTEKAGLPTLQDIVSELEKPGRDPRQPLTAFEFDASVRKPEDLREGMILPGIVTNITAFGAFVDIGVKQDGLVHVSQLSNRFVRDPNEVVKLQQQVQVKVVEVDLTRKRIALTMKF